MAGSVEVRPRRNRPRKRPVTTCNANDIDVSSIDLTDLSQLKEVSQRLNLSTRRPSTIEWKQVIELRKSMGLYGSSGDVSEIAGKFVQADIQLENGISETSRHHSPHMPKKELSVPESNHDDVKRSIADNFDEMYSGLITTLPTSPLHDDNSGRNLQLAPDFKFEKSNTETKPFVSNDANKQSVIANACTDNSVNEMMNLTTNDSDDSRLTDSQTREIENDEKEADIRLFCDSDDEFDAEYTTGLSEINVRYYTITKALGKIRRDLTTMRIEDNQLARHLLETRSQMNILKLRQSCDKHAEMLDDVAYELEEEDMLPGLIKACDLPSRPPPKSLLSAFSLLRDIGVSRMNLNRRRFSIR